MDEVPGSIPKVTVTPPLLGQGANAITQGGDYGNVFQAASYHGHETMVRLLVDQGAEVNPRGWYGNALQATSFSGHETVVQPFSPDGKTVTSASWDWTVRLWDGGTGGALQTLEGHALSYT